MIEVLSPQVAICLSKYLLRYGTWTLAPTQQLCLTANHRGRGSGRLPLVVLPRSGDRPRRGLALGQLLARRLGGGDQRGSVEGLGEWLKDSARQGCVCVFLCVFLFLFRVEVWGHGAWKWDGHRQNAAVLINHDCINPDLSSWQKYNFCCVWCPMSRFVSGVRWRR